MSKKQWRKHIVVEIESNLVKKQVEQCCPYTFVAFEVEFAEKTYRLVGFSKVSWPDVWDSQEGIDMAIRRAVYKFARQITNGKLPKHKFHAYKEYLRRFEEVDKAGLAHKIKRTPR